MSNNTNDIILEEMAEIFEDLHVYDQELVLQAQRDNDLDTIREVAVRFRKYENYMESINDSEVL